MPMFKFYYFNARGRGELIRYIFAAAGASYKDERLNFEQWGELKPNTPFGVLPVLSVDNQLLGESVAISRYLAKEFGLTGKLNWERALNDMIVDSVFDIMTKSVSVATAKMKKDEDAAKEAYDAYKEQHLLPWLNYLTKQFNASKDKWFVGNQMTWSDLAVAEFLERIQTLCDPDILNGHDRLRTLVINVHTNANIKNYTSKRPTEGVFW